MDLIIKIGLRGIGQPHTAIEREPVGMKAATTPEQSEMIAFQTGKSNGVLQRSAAVGTRW
jgi:hypothetical protein